MKDYVPTDEHLRRALVECLERKFKEDERLDEIEARLAKIESVLRRIDNHMFLQSLKKGGVE